MGLGIGRGPDRRGDFGGVRRSGTGGITSAQGLTEALQPESVVIEGESEIIDESSRIDSFGTQPQPKPASGDKRGFRDSLRSLAIIFGDISAGIEGTELTSTRLARERVEQETFQINKFKAGVDVFNSLHQTAAAIKSPDQRTAFIDSITSDPKLKKMFPEIDLNQALKESFEDDAVDPEVLSQIVGEHANAIFALAGNDMEKAISIAIGETLPGVIDILDQASDVRNIEVLPEKIKDIRAKIDEFGFGDIEGLPRDDEGRLELESFSQLEALVAQIQDPALKLTKSEIGTMRRNPRYQIALGLVTPDIAADVAKQDALGGDLDSTDLTSALRIRAGGGTVPSTISLDPAIVEFTNSLSPERADGMLPFGRQPADRPLVSQERKRDALQTEVIGALNFVREAQRIRQQSIEDPGMSTTARGLIAISGSIAANLDELADIFDKDTSGFTIKGSISAQDLESDATLRDKVESLFPGLAGKNAAFQSAAFNLAKMRLFISGETGKSISDNDLRLIIQNLGATLDDPLALQAAMQESIRQVSEAVITKAEVINFDLSRPIDISRLKALRPIDNTQFSALTTDELQIEVDRASEMTREERVELRKELNSRGL